MCFSSAMMNITVLVSTTTETEESCSTCMAMGCQRVMHVTELACCNHNTCTACICMEKLITYIVKAHSLAILHVIRSSLQYNTFPSIVPEILDIHKFLGILMSESNKQ